MARRAASWAWRSGAISGSVRQGWPWTAQNALHAQHYHIPPFLLRADQPPAPLAEKQQIAPAVPEQGQSVRHVVSERFRAADRRVRRQVGRL
jgi:hypothetical protein